MTYIENNPPILTKFSDMTKQECRQYNAWFVDAIPSRIDILKNFVRSSEGFRSWEPDCSVASIGALGSWFERNVETVPVTEMEKWMSHIVYGHSSYVSENELSNRTFSICIDIGMYFGSSLIAHCEGLRWTYECKSRRYVYFGQPLVGPFGKVDANPVGVALTVAYGIAGGSARGDSLQTVFKLWIDMHEQKGEFKIQP